MKIIIITGSLGHISKPLVQELLQKGHHVTVISSKADTQEAIEEMGAVAAIGSVEDASFLVKTFGRCRRRLIGPSVKL